MRSPFLNLTIPKFLRGVMCFIFLSFAAITSACSTGKVILDGLPPAEKTTRGKIEVLHPSSYDYSAPTPLPLVILLHGFAVNGAIQDRMFGFADHIEEGNFLFVHPNGTKGDRIGLVKPRFWSATHACCQQFGPPVNDQDFLLKLIDMIDANERLTVDRSKIYLIGHSNGAMMAYRMACKVPKKFAAIVAIGGTSYFEPSNCTTDEGETPKMNVLHIHGEDDEVINYEGGSTIGLPKNVFPVSPAIPLGNDKQGNILRYPSAPATVDTWATYNDCDASDKPSDPSLDLVDGEEFDTVVIKYDCTAHSDRSVVLWKMLETGHIPDFSDTFARQVLMHIELLD